MVELAEDGMTMLVRHPRDGLRPPGRQPRHLHGPGPDRRAERAGGVLRQPAARAHQAVPEPDPALNGAARGRRFRIGRCIRRSRSCSYVGQQTREHAMSNAQYRFGPKSLCRVRHGRHRRRMLRSMSADRRLACRSAGPSPTIRDSDRARATAEVQEFFKIVAENSEFVALHAARVLCRRRQGVRRSATTR